MDIYSVGKDELSDWDFSEVKDGLYRWIVYEYENYGYEGDGTAVAYKESDGLLYCKGLGHCSCYGPMDSWETSASKVSVEEYLRDKEDIFEEDGKDVIKSKVRELVGK